MRWSFLAIGAFIGALSLTLLGGGTACVIGDEAGAGGEATTSVVSTSTLPTSCETGVCDTCQQCAAVGICATYLANCQNDPLQQCAAIAGCVDSYEQNGDPDGLIVTCCGAAAPQYDATSVALYELAAQCVFQYACPLSCAGRLYTCP